MVSNSITCFQQGTWDQNSLFNAVSWWGQGLALLLPTQPLQWPSSELAMASSDKNHATPVPQLLRSPWNPVSRAALQQLNLSSYISIWLVSLHWSWNMFQTFPPTDSLPLALSFLFNLPLIVLQFATNPSTSKTAHIWGTSKDCHSAKRLACSIVIYMSLQVFLFGIHCLIHNPLRCIILLLNCLILRHMGWQQTFLSPYCLYHFSDPSVPLHCRWVAVLKLCHASVLSESKNLTLTKESWQKEIVSCDNEWSFVCTTPMRPLGTFHLPFALLPCCLQKQCVFFALCTIWGSVCKCVPGGSVSIFFFRME